MFKKLIRGILTLMGLLLGYIIGDSILRIEAVRKIGYLSGTVGSVFCRCRHHKRRRPYERV